MMKIWLINPYGPLPSEGWRDYSFVMMGQVLASAGHEVVWWTSNFSHHFKSFRSSDWEDIEVMDRFTVRLVPTTSYKSNRGLGRVIRDAVFAYRAFRKGCLEERPTLILYAESPLTMGYAGPALARRHGCALVYHQMDLWPELIVNSLPQVIRPLANMALLPVYWRRRATYRRLDGVMALAAPYLDAVLSEVAELAHRPQLVIYNGIDVRQFRDNMVASAKEPENIKRSPSDLIAIFAGSLGPSYDIRTLIDVARRAESAALPIKIIVAGDGPLKPQVEQASRTCKQLFYLGKLTPNELVRVFRQCDVGLAAYSAASNVEMPDKFYDYTAAGLAIVNSLEGEVASFVRTHNLGLQYRPGDSDSLFLALRRLVLEPETLSAMRASSHAIGLRFDSNLQYGQLPAFLESVVAHSTRPRP